MLLRYHVSHRDQFLLSRRRVEIFFFRIFLENKSSEGLQCYKLQDVTGSSHHVDLHILYLFFFLQSVERRSNIIQAVNRSF